MVKTFMSKKQMIYHFDYKRTYYLSGFKKIYVLFIGYTLHDFFLIHANPPSDNDCSFSIQSILECYKHGFSLIYPTIHLHW